MLSSLTLSRCRQAIVQLAAVAFSKLILEPVGGIAQLLCGVALAIPPLCRAAKDAVVETVSAYLDPVDAAAIRQGTEQMTTGLGLLAGPLAVGATLVCWNAPLLVQVLLAIAAICLPV